MDSLSPQVKEDDTPPLLEVKDDDTPKSQDSSVSIGDISIGDESIGDDDDLESLPDDSPVSSLSQGGGAKGDMEIDLSHLALSGANSIFSRKRLERDPKLFQKKDSPGYTSYSRACPSQYKKQPVILTDEEKNYIDMMDNREGKISKSYDESIRYGTGNKKYNYICPRFWCIRDDNGKGRSLSFKQVNDGECGGWNAHS